MVFVSQSVRSDSILYCAVNRSDAAPICETLVAFGSDVDAANRYGQTPLIWAARIVATDVVRLFLALNADTTKTLANGWNVEVTENADILQLLLEHSKKTVSPIALRHFV